MGLESRTVRGEAGGPSGGSRGGSTAGTAGVSAAQALRIQRLVHEPTGFDTERFTDIGSAATMGWGSARRTGGHGAPGHAPGASPPTTATPLEHTM